MSNTLDQLKIVIEVDTRKLNESLAKAKQAITNTTNVINKQTTIINQSYKKTQTVISNTSNVMANQTNIIKDSFNKTKKSSKDAADEIKKNTSIMERAFKALKVSIAAIGAYLTLRFVKQVTTAIVKTTAHFEQLRVSLKVLTGDVATAGIAFEQMAKFAATTPFALGEVVDMGKRLLSSNVQLQDLNRTMRLLGDLAAGVGKEKLPQILLAFQQVKSAGRLMGTELKQFRDTTINLSQALADELGKDVSQIERLVSAGLISFSDVEKALTRMTSKGGRFYRATEELSQTLGGLWSTTRGEIEMTMEMIGTSITEMIRLKGVLKTINEALSNYNKNRKLAKIEGQEKEIKRFMAIFAWWDKQRGKGAPQMLPSEKQMQETKKRLQVLVSEYKQSGNDIVAFYRTLTTQEQAMMRQLFENVNFLGQTRTEILEKETEAINKQNEVLNAQILRVKKQKVFFEDLEETITISTNKWADNLTDKLMEGQNAFKALGDVALSVINEIAAAALKTNVVTPLIGGVMEAIGISTGTQADKVAGLEGQKRAGGGSVSTKQAYMVGENGPEMFIPNTQGRIVPNSQVKGQSGGSQNVVINQNFNIATGAEINAIDERIRQAAPIISAQAASGVVENIRRGGPMSKLVGVRA